MKKKINIAILGATGTIGLMTAQVIRDYADCFHLNGIAAKGNNLDTIVNLIVEFEPLNIYLESLQKINKLKAALNALSYNQPIQYYYGKSGMDDFIDALNVSILVSGIVGFEGLKPTRRAISRGINIALANKETLVAAGRLIMADAKKHNVTILPVDSEHSAIFQCLQGEAYASIGKIILTASGGPFLNATPDHLPTVSIKQALNHPNWRMGSKITIDSATMFNKGLEIIEAHWLFDIAVDNIDVWVHPQSIIHSLVEFNDGSMKAQLGVPTMYIPIQYSLFFPHRKPSKTKRLDFSESLTMQFLKPKDPFAKALSLAKQALKEGDYASCCLNAANEIAVDAFLKGLISFLDIYTIVEDTLATCTAIPITTIEDVFYLDNECRLRAKVMTQRLGN